MHILLTLLMVCFPALAFAGGDGGESNLHYQVINFIVFVGILVFFGREPVRNALRDRSNKIAEEILEAQRLQQKSKAALDQYETILKDFQKERDQMLQQYRQQGENEKEELIASGKKEAERIKADAARTIENERQSLQGRIEQELVEKALQRAEEILKDNLKPKDHTRLTDEYLTQIESLSAQ